MVKKILVTLIISMLIVLAALWLWAGGYQKIKNVVTALPNPLDIIWGNASSTYTITLPGQLPIPQGPDISGYAPADSSDASDPEQQLTDAQAQYDSIRAQTQAHAAASNRSPYANAVSLSEGTAQDASGIEYLVIDAHEQIPVGGWALVSTRTGVRAQIPAYAKGPSGQLELSVLRSGDSAIVVSATSPSGSDISGSWHIYLNAGSNIWNDAHDTIELLDANNRVVDTVSY